MHSVDDRNVAKLNPTWYHDQYFTDMYGWTVAMNAAYNDQLNDLDDHWNHDSSLRNVMG